jgi:ribosomal protein L11 methyltransferase
MMTYLEIHINEISPEVSDILVALLPDMGFSGMEETPTGLKAYATEGQVDTPALDALCAELGITYSNAVLQEENWNSSWESNFDPVILPGKIHVRAHFHPPLEGFDHEILITPKMSFGTGHHATTRMMMLGMLEMDFMGKEVLDFGTGTGILAILAERLGASSIEAIDNDHWSISNVNENIQLNAARNIKVSLAENLDEVAACDMLLANINKHVLLAHASSMSQLLRPGGFLLISGLLAADQKDIEAVFEPLFGKTINLYADNGWIALAFKKQF